MHAGIPGADQLAAHADQIADQDRRDELDAPERDRHAVLTAPADRAAYPAWPNHFMTMPPCTLPPSDVAGLGKKTELDLALLA